MQPPQGVGAQRLKTTALNFMPWSSLQALDLLPGPEAHLHHRSTLLSLSIHSFHQPHWGVPGNRGRHTCHTFLSEQENSASFCRIGCGWVIDCGSDCYLPSLLPTYFLLPFTLLETKSPPVRDSC